MRRGHLPHHVVWGAGLLLGASSGLMAEGEIYVLPSGHAMDAQGNIVADDLRLTPDDRVLGEDGHGYDADQLRQGPQGEILTPDGSPVQKGFVLQPRAAIVTPAPAPVEGATSGQEPGRKGPGVKMVVGGQSEEGVAKTTTLPIIK
ncbi:MAG: hypothetical protein D6786_09780 [Gammaproteobacteria bacterium]|nr:MAG: hypothetical protein D6786_09780 [Gammaproteobacteria bacterium]